MRGVQARSAADIARELDIHWVVHRIVWYQLDYRELCAHWVPKHPKDDDKAQCMGLYGPFLYPLDMFTLIKESSFGTETWLITQNLKPGKGCMIEKLSSPSNKENGSIVISEDECGKLSWDHEHVLVFDFLDHGLTLPADCYCGTLRLWRPFFFFANGLGYFAKLLSLCVKMPGIIHPTGQLFMAVHLVSCGSVPILR